MIIIKSNQQNSNGLALFSSYSFKWKWFNLTKIYSSLSWYAFPKMKLHNHSAIAVQWTPTSQDEARTLLPPEYKKKRRRKPDRGQEVLRLYTQVSLFKDQKSRLMIQRSGHCWSLCRKGLKYFLHTRVLFRFNFPSYTQAWFACKTGASM